MAIKYFDCKGYGQIEPSQVWFNRSGMVEAQCELDPDVFASTFPVTPAETAAGKIVAEDGAFLMIDKERKIATIPTKTLSDLGYKMGINYSTERLYNQYTPGRRNFCMVTGEYLPRIGFVEPGMRICTNAVAWDDANCTLKDIDANSTSNDVYAAVKAAIATMRDATNGRKTTISNGTYTNQNYNTLAPIYCAVTAESQGKLVIGLPKAQLATKALGNVIGVVTEAYYNADNTDSFKIMFIDPATIK